MRDMLTGLPDRSMFMDILRQTVERGELHGNCCAVVLVTLDGLPEVNLRNGRSAGDAVLRSAADSLRGCISERDMVARVAGNAFALILSDVHRRADIQRVVADLRAALSLGVMDDDLYLPIQASLGVDVYPEGGKDPAGLLARAGRGATGGAAAVRAMRH
ncbi:MAG: GGDEF domain-containing protein [Proteobacteria bacterium]|nr:GGDEF domain-containing protein [Pseudomonadota bacterium]